MDKSLLFDILTHLIGIHKRTERLARPKFERIRSMAVTKSLMFEVFGGIMRYENNIEVGNSTVISRGSSCFICILSLEVSQHSLGDTMEEEHTHFPSYRLPWIHIIYNHIQPFLGAKINQTSWIPLNMTQKDETFLAFPTLAGWCPESWKLVSNPI